MFIVAIWVKNVGAVLKAEGDNDYRRWTEELKMTKFTPLMKAMLY